MTDVPDYRMEMIRLITDYINDAEYVSQTEYLECIDYLLDFNSNANYSHVWLHTAPLQHGRMVRLN